MDTLRIAMPVLVMIVIGMFCRKTAIISQTGVDNIKKYITTIALPLSIFHAVATASYDKNVALVIGIMLVVVLISFLLGFAIKGIVGEPYGKYFPYMMTIYEGGMMAYPLYQNLMGEEAMSNIALIDLPCGIFAFGVYFGMLAMTDQGVKTSGKQLMKNAFRTPTFVALLLGLGVGLLDIMTGFVEMEIGQVYVSVKNMVTAPASAMILLCVGYEFKPEKGNIGICIKTVLSRFLIQGTLMAAVLVLGRELAFSKEMMVAVVLYMMTIPSLCLSSFVKNENASKYMSTTSSFYLLITIVTYFILAGNVYP